MKNSDPDMQKPDGTSIDVPDDLAQLFDQRTLEVISTLISAIRANGEGRIEARDRLMQQAVLQYDQNRQLH